ncbi:VWA domain-containing protein [Patescibacteria group bacterium]|nr:MAG: VWA domain-containing protein [Patescibacteria group bacterium]
MDWSTKRKLEYFGILVAAILLFVVLPFFIFIYKPPTCFDGKKNSDETGVDCGGSCRLLCRAEALDPILKWDPRIFRVSLGVYSLLAYVENPNVSAGVRSAPYIFRIYDKEGLLILERRGSTFIPRGKTFAVFDGNFSLEERIPAKATFEWGELVWSRTTVSGPEISITNKALMREETTPRVEATVENKSLEPIRDLELTALIFDSDGNAIASSRTFLEYLDKGGEAEVVFTWPQPFPTRAEVCAAPVDVTLVLDRSGSMDDLGANPPQPLTDVKNAAVYFVNLLHEKDQAAVVSFATEAASPIESVLGRNFEAVKRAIERIAIRETDIQHTNIADGLLKAKEELVSSRHASAASQVAILLTDGVATRPEKGGDPGYPETYAQQVANDMRQSRIALFTIGLGKNVNESFLRSIASSSEEFFLTPTAKELRGVYKKIAEKICTTRAAVIEIIPRIYPR